MLRKLAGLLTIAVLTGLVAGLAGACSPKVDPDQPQSAATRKFRETHFECNPRFFRQPCQIGPDGRLYEYNPGEKDPPAR